MNASCVSVIAIEPCYPGRDTNVSALVALTGDGGDALNALVTAKKREEHRSSLA